MMLFSVEMGEGFHLLQGTFSGCVKLLNSERAFYYAGSKKTSGNVLDSPLFSVKASGTQNEVWDGWLPSGLGVQ